jgi:hypothetical protein
MARGGRAGETHDETRGKMSSEQWHDRSLYRPRVIAGTLAGGASLVGGLAIIWAFAPSLFLGVGTGQLLAVLGLLALPVLVWWGVRRDRRRASEWDAQVQEQREAVEVARAARAVVGLSMTPESPATAEPKAAPVVVVAGAAALAPAGARRAESRRVLHEPAFSGDATRQRA